MDLWRGLSIANLQSADFGLAVFLLQSGVLITVLFSLFVFLPVLYLYNLVFVLLDLVHQCLFPILGMAWLVNSIISLMYFASLVHYTVAFKRVVHTFSYHLGIVLLSIYKIKRINLVDSSTDTPLLYNVPFLTNLIGSLPDITPLSALNLLILFL